MASVDSLTADIAQGNNSLTAERLFHEKQYYYNEIYPDEESLPWVEKPIDFINKNPLYGKVNPEGQFIKANIAKLEVISDKKTSVQVLDFVAAAFIDLKEYVQTHIEQGWLSGQGPIAEFSPRKAFIDFDQIVEMYHEVHYFNFVGGYLNAPINSFGKRTIKESIKNIADFIKYFNLYLKENAATLPFTECGMINSFYTSPLTTGLCIEIDDKKYDSDEDKHKFIKDPNFNFYKIAARKFGFMIDRNIPWRLVADIRSYKMREYMRLAIELPEIEKRRNEILAAAKEEIKNKFPAIPTLEQLKNPNFNSNLASWDIKKIENFRQETKNKILNATLNIINNPSWAKKLGYGVLSNAKDPLIDPHTGTVVCPQGKCLTRILKFENVFNEYYHVAYSADISKLIKRLFQFYKSYVMEFPVINITTVVDCSPPKTIVSEHTLQNITLLEFHDKYDKLFWYKTYLDIKLTENKILLKTLKYKKIIKKLFQLATLNAPYPKTATIEGSELHFGDYSVQLKLKAINLMIMSPEEKLDTTRTLLYINNVVRKNRVNVDLVYIKEKISSEADKQIQFATSIGASTIGEYTSKFVLNVEQSDLAPSSAVGSSMY